MPEDFSELENRLTDTARASLERAGSIAQEIGSPYIGTEHLLLGVLAQNSSLGAKILADSGVTLDRAEVALDITMRSFVVVMADKGISQEILQTIRTAWQVATEFGQEFIGTEHLIYSILSQADARATRLLREMNIDIDTLRSDFEQVFDRQQYESLSEPSSTKSAKDVGVLEKYGSDLTMKAHNGELDPVIGRDKEIDRMVTILGRRSKNNPALIGEPGVGKTAIVEGLAQRIADGKVPEFLQGRRLILLDLVSMIAGTKYRGQFEERLQKVLDVLKKHPEIIIFIDELHVLVGAGSAEGSMDAANIVKPALARGEIRMIGATTFDEYRKHIEKDAALTRRFQTITVNEPSTDEAVAMVRGLAAKLATHHRVSLADDILRQAVELSERYVTDRRLPDKAIDVIDEAAALLRSEQAPVASKRHRYERQIRSLARRIDVAVEEQNYEQAALLKVQLVQLEQRSAELEDTDQPQVPLTERYVRRAVAAMTDIPLAHIDQIQLKTLSKLESRLKKRIVGQDDVVSEIAKTIKRARSGLASPTRPLGSFVLLGPTGVGKTELARVLAEEVFGGKNSLIKIDMSEFGEKHTASRLVGAPAGYVGYDDGGKLTEAVKRRPYSVVLFDEIEKAHPDVLNLLLQLLEDGQLTDAQGRVVSFRQTIIILTSNLGADKMIREAELGFQATSAKETLRMSELHQRNSREARRELEMMMRPELINRFDGIFTFKALTRSVVEKIFDLIVADMNSQVAAQGRQLKVQPSAKKHLISEGYDEHHGVRPLRRVVEQQLIGAVADVLISGKSSEGDILEARARQGKVVVDVKST
ncbi:ATP-dependent Clp protease ATP-binding protein ClpC [Candidatus Saccharibacteria bacterium 32-49-12]|nr:MAG: ATP-dependent Clp protease ATP-binding protein ClpC [Candidatus Saccharibacteria bacterium 32-49-12]